MNQIDKVIKDLEILGLNSEKISKLDGGINSGTYKIETNSAKYVLKIYNKSKTNNINRFYNEKKFLEFLHNCDFKNVPKIIKTNSKKNWLLISWIEGKKIHNVSYDSCKQLLDFLIKLQDFRQSPFARALPLAADTFSNLYGYISAIEDRLLLLINKQQEFININEDLASKLKKLIIKTKSDITSLIAFSKSNKIDLNYIFPESNKIISQSDVGFHNIIYKNNEANFIDFEYAGWDDPYKLFCDLLLQPDNNIPLKFIDVLDSYVKKYIFNISSHNKRLLFMLKLNRLKWSLIILNPILNNDQLSKQDFSDLLENRIKKSKEYLDKSALRINDINENFLIKYTIKKN